MKSLYTGLFALAAIVLGAQQGSETPSEASIWTLETTTTVQPSTTTTVPSVAVRSRVAGTTSTTTSTTTTTIPGISDARYPEYWPTAVDVGWPTEWLSTLDLIIQKENRGIPG